MKILFQLDDLDNIEANLVAEAANRLGVGEFQFFQLAFQAWYGHEIDPAQLERDFWSYLTHDEVPPWVRHYARNIIKADDEGELDQNEHYYHRHDRFGPNIIYDWREKLKAILLLVFMVVFFLFVLYIYEQHVPEKYQCNFPPCSEIQ